jgi:hypothetical protein
MKPSLEQLIQQLEQIVQQLTVLEAAFNPGRTPIGYIQKRDQNLVVFKDDRTLPVGWLKSLEIDAESGKVVNVSKTLNTLFQHVSHDTKDSSKL